MNSTTTIYKGCTGDIADVGIFNTMCIQGKTCTPNQKLEALHVYTCDEDVCNIGVNSKPRHMLMVVGGVFILFMRKFIY